MSQIVIHRDPWIQGGVPVLAGTRVALKNLFDSLEAGDIVYILAPACRARDGGSSPAEVRVRINQR